MLWESYWAYEKESDGSRGQKFQNHGRHFQAQSLFLNQHNLYYWLEIEDYGNRNLHAADLRRWAKTQKHRKDFLELIREDGNSNGGYELERQITRDDLRRWNGRSQIVRNWLQGLFETYRRNKGKSLVVHYAWEWKTE